MVGTGTEDYFNGGWYFRDGEFKRLLGAGRHWFFDPLGKVNVEVVSQRAPWLAHEKLDVIVKSGALKDRAVVLRTYPFGESSTVAVFLRGPLPVLNKLDLMTADEAEKRCKEIVRRLRWKGPVFRISGATRFGTKELCQAVMRRLDEIREEQGPDREPAPE